MKIQKMILLWQETKKVKEELEITRNKLNKEFEKTNKLEQETFQYIADFIQGLLEGKTIKGKEIKFSPPGRFDGRESRWIYSFGLRNNRILDVIIAENDGVEGEVKFYIVNYDLKTKELCLEGEVG